MFGFGAALARGSRGERRSVAPVGYGWNIVDSQGATILDGIDVAELESDGSLRRVVMFFGPLPSPEK